MGDVAGGLYSRSSIFGSYIFMSCNLVRRFQVGAFSVDALKRGHPPTEAPNAGG